LTVIRYKRIQVKWTGKLYGGSLLAGANAKFNVKSDEFSEIKSNEDSAVFAGIGLGIGYDISPKVGLFTNINTELGANMTTYNINAGIKYSFEN